MKDQRIMLLKTGSIGDVLMTTPAVRMVREAFGAAHITYLVGKSSRDILLHNPRIDEVIAFDEGIFLKRRYRDILKLLASLRGKRFDTVIAFHMNRLAHLFSCLTGASRRVSVSNGGGKFLTHRLDFRGRESMHPADLYMELVSTIGLPARPRPMEIFVSDQEKRFARNFIARNFGADAPVIGLFPGGGENAAVRFTHKRWDTDNFDCLCRLLLRRFPDCGIVIFGSRGERDLSSKLVPHPLVIDLVGRTTLREMIALMSGLDLMVTNDSCPLHLGTALGIPMVSLFGPTSPRKYAKECRHHKVLTAGLPCSPCEDARGRFVPNCADNVCMDSITPEEVFIACKELLDARGDGMAAPREDMARFKAA